MGFTERLNHPTLFGIESDYNKILFLSQNNLYSLDFNTTVYS